MLGTSQKELDEHATRIIHQAVFESNDPFISGVKERNPITGAMINMISKINYQYPTHIEQLEEIVPLDEMILKPFFKKESKDHPPSKKFLPSAKYKNVGNYMRGLEKSTKKYEKNLAEVIMFRKADEHIAEYVELLTACNLLISGVYGLELKANKAISGHAQILSDQPEFFVKESKNRDQIYRNIFETAEDFIAYQNIVAGVGTQIQYRVTNMNIPYFLDFIEDAHPIFHKFFMLIYKKGTSKLPSAEESEQHTADINEFAIKRAERIYN